MPCVCTWTVQRLPQRLYSSREALAALCAAGERGTSSSRVSHQWLLDVLEGVCLCSLTLNITLHNILSSVLPRAKRHRARQVSTSISRDTAGVFSMPTTRLPRRGIISLTYAVGGVQLQLPPATISNQHADAACMPVFVRRLCLLRSILGDRRHVTSSDCSSAQHAARRCPRTWARIKDSVPALVGDRSGARIIEGRGLLEPCSRPHFGAQCRRRIDYWQQLSLHGLPVNTLSFAARIPLPMIK